MVFFATIYVFTVIRFKVRPHLGTYHLVQYAALITITHCLIYASINKLYVNNFSVSPLPGNITRMNLIIVGLKRGKSLHEDPSSKPIVFNTFLYTFYTFFHEHDILNISTFTKIQFKVRPHLLAARIIYLRRLVVTPM